MEENSKYVEAIYSSRILNLFNYLIIIYYTILNNINITIYISCIYYRKNKFNITEYISIASLKHN